MDELERRIRAARPLSGHRDLPLTDRAKRELAELMLAAPHPRIAPARRPYNRRRSIRRAGAMAMAAAVAVVGGIAATDILAPRAAIAATPPLLTVTATTETTQELLTDISEKIDRGDPVPTAPLRILVEAWSLQVEDDGQALTSIVVPERYDITRGADGSYGKSVTTGQAIDGSGNSADDAPPAGELLWEESWDPGEYLFFFETFPEKSEDVGPFFQASLGLDAPLSSVAAIQATNDLLFEQVLSPRQRAALLEFFANQPDLRPLGDVVDRLGRAGIAFAADDPDRPDYQRHLIVSPETGAILATETIYIGSDRSDIASPSVVNYFAWKQENE